MIFVDTLSPDFRGDPDLLSHLIVRDDVRGKDYLRDIVLSLLVVGRDTVVAGLTELFWLLSRNLQVQERIMKEIDRILGPSLELQFNSKYAKKDGILPDGYPVTKGCRVTYHPYAMAREERIWGADCKVFNPEWWLNQDISRKRSYFKYPVFSRQSEMVLWGNICCYRNETCNSWRVEKVSNRSSWKQPRASI
ncbi:putative cytochrome P450 [Medicago truncatula]|uniref:Cytochrome P450 n=1 Tax=Medicago truncatula TaxID=3880 RepID=A2Q3J7_MEDTR|nr:cytochrome P450 94C1 [Medicago truncatula]ABN08192.1 Cytochrome P450 [Medicago truncatula]AES66114.2 cytochrome P450 family protein [Medicago truncatula]RHN74349.1 putative cytochrome P450 [Medicago truncatula]